MVRAEFLGEEHVVSNERTHREVQHSIDVAVQVRCPHVEFDAEVPCSLGDRRVDAREGKVR